MTDWLGIIIYNFSPDVPGDAAVDQGFVILTRRPDEAGDAAVGQGFVILITDRMMSSLYTEIFMF